MDDVGGNLNIIGAVGGTYQLKNGVFIAMEYDYLQETESNVGTMQIGVEF